MGIRAKRPARATEPSEVTLLLERMRQGDTEACERVYQLVYAELRRMASRHLRRQRPGHMMQPSDVVQEAFVRLAAGKGVDSLQNRAHFFAVAARAIRQILVDHARRNLSAKRGGGLTRLTLDDTLGLSVDRGEELIDILDLDRALDQLGELHERQRKVIELRFFAGFTIAETADVLGVSTDTVEDDTAVARVWLRRALRSG